MRHVIVTVVFILFSLFLAPLCVQAKIEVQSSDSAMAESENSNTTMVDGGLSEYDFKSIQDEINQNTGLKSDISFSEIVKQLVSGDVEGSVKNVGNVLGNVLFEELNTNKKVLIQLILIAVIAAVFTNFSNIFINNYIGETGFFVTYLLIFSILSTSFLLMVSIAKDAVNGVLSFMQALIPTYSLAITVTSGMTTSLALYQALVFAITVAEWVIIKVVFPLVNVFVILELVNNMEKEDRFSKMAALIKKIINWILKSLVVFIIGFHFIQGLIMPAVDSVKHTVFQKGMQAIPGAGQIFGTVASTIIGSGVVIKNSIGVAGLIIILVLVSMPVIKLVIFVLGYRFTAALLQPISDARIVRCLNSTSDGAQLLLDSVISAAALFLLSIALIAASTNMNYYVG